MYKERRGERMKKKLLAGILALALCSTNMPPPRLYLRGNLLPEIRM